MKVQVAIDIDTKKLSLIMFDNLLDYFRENYGISEEDIEKDSLILLIDKIYKEMEKKVEE